MSALAAERAEIEHCLASGDRARAFRLSAALLDAYPGDADVRILHAMVLMAGGDWSGAAAQLEQCLGSPRASWLANARLALCRTRLGDREGALSAYRAALAERPGDFVQRLAYGECLQAMAREEAAVGEFFRALCDAQAAGAWRNDATTPPHLRDRVRNAMETVDRGRARLFGRLLDRQVAAFGEAAMRRVREALALYLGEIQAPAGDPRQHSKFFHMPGLPPTPYYPRERFDWYPLLESATDAIRGELDAVLRSRGGMEPFLGVPAQDVGDEYLGGDPASRAWDAYFLHRHGKPFDQHLLRCPGTAAVLSRVPLTIVRDHAPEVLFSLLAPGTHIKPHHGVTNTRVVTHLPLIVPEGDCRLAVGGEAHAWREGRCITFDDTFLHEAWNRTGELRVVMILDTWNPDMTPEERIAVRELIEGIGDFNAQANA